MYRRNFLALAIVAAFTPAAWAGQAFIPYQPGVIQAALDSGKTVFVDYFAPWCATCRAQERRVEELRKANPDYDVKMVFVRVDWDTYRSQPVVTSREIPRRSTLLLLRGDAELGRIVAGTKKAEIKALLDKGLAADS